MALYHGLLLCVKPSLHFVTFQPVENLWKTCGKPVENLWKTCGKPVENWAYFPSPSQTEGPDLVKSGPSKSAAAVFNLWWNLG